MSAVKHPKEAVRDRAVRETGLLDRPIDRVQQSAARLASEILGTPIAAVSLISGDRQWFSAIHGIDCRQTGRDEAFCAHTILSDAPFIVEDALEDPRFRDNPLVTGDLKVRFYAGVALRTHEDLPLGSLCVIDHEPRSPSNSQIGALETLASLVAAELDMLRLHRALDLESQRSKRALGRERRIAAALPGAIAELRVVEGRGSIDVTFASAQLRTVLGEPAQRSSGRLDLLCLVHPDDRARLLAALESPPEDRCARVIEFRGRPRSIAEDRWFELSAVGCRIGRTNEWHAFMSDSTERRRADRVSSRLAAIVEHSEEAILSLDLDRRITSWNAAAERIFGISTADAVGRSTDIVVPPDRRNEHRIGVARTLAGSGTTRIETVRTASNGDRRTVLSAMSPVRDRAGEVVGLSEILTDITRRRRVESQLAESLRVVDDVSHEFRTPLAVIREFSSIISDGIAGPVSDTQREYLAIIGGAVSDLNHMVEDLLDSSRLRAGSLRIERRPTSVEQVLTSMRGAMSAKADLRGIQVRQQVDPSLPEVFCDEGKLRRVLTNLLTNAVKFSPEGGEVSIGAERGRRPDEVTISVTDRGPGLDPGDIKRLFGRFEQLSSGHQATAKGFGLGLSIARELAWLNLGRLSVTSRKGEGATFHCSLPIAECRSILEHAADTIHALDDEVDPLVAVEVTPMSCDEDDLLIAWLCSASFATDLVLPAGRGDDSSHRVLVIGRSRAPHAWLDRLQHEHQRRREDDPKAIPDARFELGESWPPGTPPSEWIHSLISKEVSA